MTTPHQVAMRVQPIKNTLALMGVEKHDKRDSKPSKGFAPERTHLNETLIGSDSLYKDTVDIVDRHIKAHPKSTIAAEMILTASVSWFDEISPKWRDGIYTKEFVDWRDLTTKWLVESFPGVAHLSLHMDETTPHFHAIVVPVHTKKISYRRGSKNVTRIRYNDVFGDDMQTIVAARKANDSELTKLGRMQTAYANAMKTTGLKRGISNINIYHEAISDYQKRISTPVAVLAEYEKSPDFTFQDKAYANLGISTENLREADRVKADNYKKFNENQEVFKQMEAKARDYDRMKTENDAMKKALITKDEKLAQQGADLRAAVNAKEVVTKLRGLDIVLVAERLGVTPTKNDRNAVDLVKNHAGFTYEESIAWLYNEFDSQEAIYTAAAHAIEIATRITKIKPEQPLSPLDIATAVQVTRQLTAIGASRYRLTMMVADSSDTSVLHTYNYGKGKAADKKELFYSANDITRVIPFLRRENTRGYNIIITPYDDNMLYLLLDDLTNITLPIFNSAGYKPNVLQQTSKERMQAVFVLSKHDVSEESRNALFNELNTLYGDANITGYNHGFRLAGFTNAKLKHIDAHGKRPIVRVLHTATTTCAAAVAWCRNFMSVTTMPKKTKVQRNSDTVKLHTSILDNMTKIGLKPSIEASKEATQFYSWIVSRYGLEADFSRADFMLVERMTNRFTLRDIAIALLTHSPGIEQRHQDVMRYVYSTVGSVTKPL